MLRRENGGTLKGVLRCSGLRARSLCDGGSISQRLGPPQSEVELQFVTIRKLLTRCGARMPLQASMTCLAHSRLDANWACYCQAVNLLIKARPLGDFDGVDLLKVEGQRKWEAERC